MNIKEAKTQIINAVSSYRMRDDLGRLLIPQKRQRPLFLMGAPGVGKTAIVEQAAQQLGIPLVSYSITHHTRQSALGLPYITEKEYDGSLYRVSEYTMSEIIGAVHEAIRRTGIRDGILFLDEVNCVSETLAPSMLQFLQYKVFGQHRLPEGWTVVTAGNPPEYNTSVREFDMVTWDRLKRIDIDIDFDTWREWAKAAGVHPAIVSYLDIRREDLYMTETTVSGRSFVTPRGWTDLSDMMLLYEKQGIRPDLLLAGQYLQNHGIAVRFSQYYELWLKYKADYRIEEIMNGGAGEEIRARAAAAGFDERMSLIALILDALCGRLSDTVNERSMLRSVIALLNEGRMLPVRETLKKACDESQTEMAKADMISGSAADEASRLTAALNSLLELTERTADDAEARKVIRQHIADRRNALAEAAQEDSRMLDHVFSFVSSVYGQGHEMLVLVTELTASPAASAFIGAYGCEAYFKNNQDLLFYERDKQIRMEAAGLDELQPSEE